MSALLWHFISYLCWFGAIMITVRVRKLAWVLLLCSHCFAQTSESERQQIQLNTEHLRSLDRQVTALELVRSDPRLSVLEQKVEAINSWLVGLASTTGLLIVGLLTALFTRRRNGRSPYSEAEMRGWQPPSRGKDGT